MSARPLLCQGSRGCLHPMPRCSPHHSGDSTTCVESLTTGFAVYCSYKTLEILNVRTKIHEQHQEMDNKQQRWSLLHLFQEFFRISQSLYQASVLKLNSESSEMVCRQLANLRSSPCCTYCDILMTWISGGR